MREDYRLLTPENVELRFDVAGIGSRLMAAMIDYSIIAVGEVVLMFGTAFGASLAPRIASRLSIEPQVLGFIGFAAYAVVILLAFLGWWGYFILFEVMWNGQTPGKRWLGVRVVRADGQSINATASLVRNLLRVVDSMMLIGVLVMLIDRASRRLGDLAAGSLVVHEPRPLARDALSVVAIPWVAQTSIEAIPNADRLTMAHYTIVRDFFARRPRLAMDRGLALAKSLANDFALILEVPASDVGDPERFLASVAHAYEARHKYYDAPV